MNGIVWFGEIDKEFVKMMKYIYRGELGLAQVEGSRTAFHAGFSVASKFFRDNDMKEINAELAWDQYSEYFKEHVGSTLWKQENAKIMFELNNRN